MKRLLLGGSHHGEKHDLPEGVIEWRMPAKLETSALRFTKEEPAAAVLTVVVEEYLMFAFTLPGMPSRDAAVFVLSSDYALGLAPTLLGEWLGQFV